MEGRRMEGREEGRQKERRGGKKNGSKAGVGKGMKGEREREGGWGAEETKGKAMKEE